MKSIIISCCFLTALMVSVDADAQLLKKLKDKVAKKAEDIVDGKTGGTSQNSTSTSEAQVQATSNTASNASSSSKPTNKGGAGLSNTTPPDVMAQITEAEAAHTAKSYSDARYSLQQAMQGIEIQLGKSILKSLPPTVSALPADTTKDKVMSTQWGWNNLTIQRVYRQGDKELTITIGNNSAYSTAVNMYFANAAYIKANAEKQNIKQVKVKGNKAIIQYEDSKGYTLMMQLGQSALVVWECINFSTEQEVMNAANSFDIDHIKKSLGEQ